MRSKISFNQDWFFYHGEKEQDPASRDIEEFRKVQLPHDWSLDYPFDEKAFCLGSGGYVETGIGYYKKLFHCDKGTSPDERFVIRFDGAYMMSSVWLNGKKLGTHVYGYTPFEFDVTEELLDGENLIFVKVDNSRQPNSRWYTGSGITRNVWLIRTARTHIASYGIHAVTEQVGDKQWKLTADAVIEDPENRKPALLWTLRDEETEVRFEGESVLLDNPKLWSADHPALYDLTAFLVADGIEIDSVTIRIGIRETRFDADLGFFCNGEPIKLNGVCFHHDAGCVGAAVPACMWERRLKKLKTMGCNAVRMSHNPPDPAVLDLCDEIGLFVMDEAFDEWNIVKNKDLGSNTDASRGYSDYFEECWEEDLKAMLLRDRNHPGIVIWSIGNEIPNQTDADGHLLARKLKETVRSFDGTRPVTVACDQIEAEPRKATEDFLNELDIVGYNYAGRWRKRAETYYDTDKRKHPEWKMIGTENTSFASTRGTYLTELENREGWLTFPYYSVAVGVGRLLRFTMTHDYVSGDFMWTGFDYLGEAGWPHRSASSGVMDTCGYEKMGYYFYKSIWDRKNPMVHVEPHWNFREHDGKIIQVICFTNCEEAELFLNGKSYGRKAYSYPAYGMTERYGHFDKIPIPPSTDNLFLSWDVPFVDGEVTVKGYTDGVEIASDTVRTAGAPADIEAAVYRDTVSVGKEEVIQLEVSLTDVAGVCCADSKEEIRVHAENATVIGCDSGNPISHENMRTDHIQALAGKAFFVLRPDGPGECSITVSCGALKRSITVTAL